MLYYGAIPDPTECLRFGIIDQLSYTYGSGRLQEVKDNAPAEFRDYGFKENSSAPYVYDNSGNLIQDPHKGLNIEYNFMNLPQRVQKVNINLDFTYDATGKKWQKKSSAGNRYYLNGIEYFNGKVESIHWEEGRLAAVYDEFGVALQSYRSEYSHTDLLGNTRLTFSDLNNNRHIEYAATPSEIMQEEHYYPFGLNQVGDWYTTTAPENKYQFNGKELNEEMGLNWYAYGARHYDAAVGRFTGVDPIADRFAYVSVYNYAENGPVNAIDLHGLQRYLVINGYVNQQLSQTTISTVKGANGQLLNLRANNGQGGTVPSDVLVINEGNLPDGVKSSERRDNLTNDENQIISAGVDATQSLIGDGGQGLSSINGFSLPGSYPKKGETFTGELFVGNYADVQTPVMGNISSPVRKEIAANFGFVTIGNPSYQVTGIMDINGRGTNSILDRVKNGINSIINNGGTINSIDVRIARGTGLNNATASAIRSFASSNLLPAISSKAGILNVGFTFNGNVRNNVIRINGTQNQIGQVGLQVARTLIP